MKLPEYFKYYHKEKSNPYDPDRDLEKNLVWNVERRFFEDAKNGSKMKQDLESMIQYYFDLGFTDSDNPETEFLAMLLDWYKQYDSKNTVWGFIDLCARRYDLESIVINRQNKRTIVFRSVSYYHGEDADQNPINTAADRFFTSRIAKQTTKEAYLQDQEILFDWTARLVEDRALRRRSRMMQYFKLSDAGKNTQQYLEQAVESDPVFKQTVAEIFDFQTRNAKDLDADPDADS
ncbi:MAG: hypothetical protein IJ552_07585 [Prevotella sp.]|nr:hypothetical protein [Prevotella sp.]